MTNNSQIRLEMLKASLAEDPLDWFSQYALALEYQNQDRRQAIALLEDLLSKNTEYLPAYYQLGKLYEQDNKVSEALEIYTNGIEVARRQKAIKTQSELQGAYDMLAD